MTPWKIAISPCPNDVFAFGPIILGHTKWHGPALNFFHRDIQALNRWGLAEDRPEILKFSYACWPRLKEHYRLLKVGSALGFGVGPLLVGAGDRPLGERKTLLIPGQETTAALLAKKFAPKISFEEVSYEEIIPRLKNNEDLAGVIIHESRFTYPSFNLKCLLDLGALWEKSTSLPLPLGGVAIRRGLSEDSKESFENALTQSLSWAWKHPKSLTDLMQNHAQEMSESVMNQHVRLYVNQDTLKLSKKGIQAIALLCDLPTEEVLA